MPLARDTLGSGRGSVHVGRPRRALRAPLCLWLAVEGMFRQPHALPCGQEGLPGAWTGLGASV